MSDGPMQNPLNDPEPPDYGDQTWLDDAGDEWRDCWQCGGEGFIDGECTCMDDTCCCLYPEAPDCDVCHGNGVLKVNRVVP